MRSYEFDKKRIIKRRPCLAESLVCVYVHKQSSIIAKQGHCEALNEFEAEKRGEGLRWNVEAEKEAGQLAKLKAEAVG